MHDESCTVCRALDQSLSDYLAMREEGFDPRFQNYDVYEAATRQAVRRIQFVIATHEVWVHDSFKDLSDSS